VISQAFVQSPEGTSALGACEPVHRVLIADTSIRVEGLRLLEKSVSVIELPAYSSERNLIDAARNVDGILARACVISAPVILSAKKLKIVSRHGVGFDNVDVAECTRHGIAVSITEEANAQAVSEHAFAGMLAVANKIVPAHEAVRAGEWDRSKWVGVELHGKVLGIIGLGRIGSRVARQGAAVDMEILACDPYIESAEATRVGATLVDPKTLLSRSDFISLHAPLREETRHMIGSSELGMMKSSVILVNTSRGGIIDDGALCHALATGAIAAAAIDVFEEEPVAQDHPLLKMANVLYSPHVAGQSEESMVRMSVGAAQNILRVLDGEPPSYLVNPEVLTDRSRINWRS